MDFSTFSTEVMPELTEEHLAGAANFDTRDDALTKLLRVYNKTFDTSKTEKDFSFFEKVEVPYGKETLHRLFSYYASQPLKFSTNNNTLDIDKCINDFETYMGEDEPQIKNSIENLVTLVEIIKCQSLYTHGNMSTSDGTVQNPIKSAAIFRFFNDFTATSSERWASSCRKNLDLEIYNQDRVPIDEEISTSTLNERQLAHLLYIKRYVLATKLFLYLLTSYEYNEIHSESLQNLSLWFCVCLAVVNPGLDTIGEAITTRGLFEEMFEIKLKMEVATQKHPLLLDMCFQTRQLFTAFVRTTDNKEKPHPSVASNLRLSTEKVHSNIHEMFNNTLVATPNLYIKTACLPVTIERFEQKLNIFNASYAVNTQSADTKPTCKLADGKCPLMFSGSINPVLGIDTSKLRLSAHIHNQNEAYPVKQLPRNIIVFEFMDTAKVQIPAFLGINQYGLPCLLIPHSKKTLYGLAKVYGFGLVDPLMGYGPVTSMLTNTKSSNLSTLFTNIKLNTGVVDETLNLVYFELSIPYAEVVDITKYYDGNNEDEVKENNIFWEMPLLFDKSQIFLGNNSRKMEKYSSFLNTIILNS